MPRTYILVILSIVMALNVIVLVHRMQGSTRNDALLPQSRTQETQERIAGLRRYPKGTFHSGYHFIGGLVTSDYWTSVLPVSDEQAVALKKLDLVVWGARVVSKHEDADYLETNPIDYREYLENSEVRRKEAIKHGQLMTLSGLLTDRQADFVIQRHLSDRRGKALHDETVQELLKIGSKVQIEKLANVRREYNHRTGPLFIDSMAPLHNSNVNSDIKKHKKEYSASSLSLLTPSQRATWRRLTANRQLPTTAPEMPVPGDMQRGRMESKELSAVFRVLAEQEDMLALSEEQKRLLDDLCSVTQLGLFWINATAADQPASKVEAGKNQDGGIVRNRAEFLKHAEQVALLGVLTEYQAKQVSPAL